MAKVELASGAKADRKNEVEPKRLEITLEGSREQGVNEVYVQRANVRQNGNNKIHAQQTKLQLQIEHKHINMQSRTMRIHFTYSR